MLIERWDAEENEHTTSIPSSVVKYRIGGEGGVVVERGEDGTWRYVSGPKVGDMDGNKRVDPLEWYRRLAALEEKVNQHDMDISLLMGELVPERCKPPQRGRKLEALVREALRFGIAPALTDNNIMFSVRETMHKIGPLLRSVEGEE